MEIKDDEKIEKWSQRSSSEIAVSNEKSAINFFNIAGIIIAVVGLLLGWDDWSLLIMGVSFGIIIIGIGEILRQLNKISNKSA